MKQHWQTNLGGAISVTGTTLIGIGVLTQLTQLSPGTSMFSQHQLAVLWYVAVVGFVLSAVGKGLTALFAADAGTVNNIAAAVDQINQQGASPLAAPATTQPKGN